MRANSLDSSYEERKSVITCFVFIEWLEKVSWRESYSPHCSCQSRNNVSVYYCFLLGKNAVLSGPVDLYNVSCICMKIAILVRFYDTLQNCKRQRSERCLGSPMNSEEGCKLVFTVQCPHPLCKNEMILHSTFFCRFKRKLWFYSGRK